MMIHSSSFLFSTLLTGFSLMSTFHPMVVAVDPTASSIKIDTTVTAFTFDTEGAGSVTISYLKDDLVTFGASTSGSPDFYVLQTLKLGGCGALDERGYYAAFSDKEPGTYGTTSTTTTLALGTNPFPQGETTFCLKVDLMLNMLDGAADKIWQTVNFGFTVTATYATGSGTASYAASEVFGEEAGTGTATGADTATPPTVAANIQGPTLFRYGQDIVVDVTFNHALPVFEYTKNTQFLSSAVGSATHLTIGGTEVAPIVKSWAPNYSFAAKTIGTLTIQLPIKLYQDDTINQLAVNVVIDWVYKNPAARQLRSLQGESGTYTGPSSGAATGGVAVTLEPYKDESGAIVGYTVISVVSSVALGATTLLL